MEELLEAFKSPLAPTAEDLGTGFATGGLFTAAGMLYDLDTGCEVIIPKDVGHGILFDPEPIDSRLLRRPHPLPMGVRDVTTFENGWQMPTEQVWKPLYPLVSHTVSQTFPMSALRLRQIMKILGNYRIPGDKPLIHKGKKP